VIVVDASAVVDLLLNTDRARDVAVALDSAGEIHAPELIEPEVLSAVRRWLSRRWITHEAADRAVARLGELAMVRHRHAVLRPSVWSLRDRCTTYDACYVALAQLLDARLLTTDERLASAAEGLVAVIDLDR
jgi:predicted nucleic acid-binding protein